MGLFNLEGRPMSTENQQNDANHDIQPTVFTDQCPDWASTVIARILVLEIETGTIKNLASAEKNPAWATSSLDQLSKVAAKLDRDDLQDLSQEVEALFERLAKGLHSEGFDANAIAAMINARIPTGCRLPYCSAAEVALVTS
jgi:hypothetical protein